LQLKPSIPPPFPVKSHNTKQKNAMLCVCSQKRLKRRVLSLAFPSGNIKSRRSKK
jgi:hypothetical protein